MKHAPLPHTIKFIGFNVGPLISLVSTNEWWAVIFTKVDDEPLEQMEKLSIGWLFAVNFDFGIHPLLVNAKRVTYMTSKVILLHLCNDKTFIIQHGSMLHWLVMLLHKLNSKTHAARFNFFSQSLLCACAFGSHIHHQIGLISETFKWSKVNALQVVLCNHVSCNGSLCSLLAKLTFRSPWVDTRENLPNSTIVLLTRYIPLPLCTRNMVLRWAHKRQAYQWWAEMSEHQAEQPCSLVWKSIIPCLFRVNAPVES